jgi:hypothetical protein
VSASKLLLERQMGRWYELKDHPVQNALTRAVSDGIRFPVVPAGRRSGKTERLKRFVAQQAMWLPNERFFLKIFMPNGTEIHVVGLDQPQRFEGIEWTGGGIDEIADVKAEALQANIMPALNTVNPTRPMYRAWCWWIGVPDGLNHYYDMAEYARTSGDPQWGLFHWKSSEILPADVIDQAKRTMGRRQYLQEYEASFETATGRIYDDYDGSITGRNHTYRTLQPHEAIHWMHDQNFTPLSSAIAVVENNNIYLVDEIVLESAISAQSADEFVDKFKNHKNKTVFIYGDPAGRAGEKHGHKSDYVELEEILRLHDWKFERRVRLAHPSIRDRQNAVRAKILNAKDETTLFINPNTATWCHKGLATVQLQPGSTFQEDQKNPYQHITTAIGYFIDWHWPAGRSKGGRSTTTGNH